MKVHVEFFSSLRPLAGLDKLPVELPDGASVAKLLDELYARFPRMREADRSLLVAIGVEFARRDAVLRDGDAVALMPPVQGG